MELEIYQWLVPLISVYYIYRTIVGVMQKKRSVPSSIVWIFFWTTLIVLAIVPHPFTTFLMNALGFKSNITAIIFVALGLLFLVVFYLSSVIESLERQMTELVRRSAMHEEEARKLKAEQKTSILSESKVVHQSKKVSK